MQASATLLLVAPRLKLAWNSTSSGPITPSAMCAWNQRLVVPRNASARTRLRSG